MYSTAYLGRFLALPLMPDPPLPVRSPGAVEMVDASPPVSEAGLEWGRDEGREDDGDDDGEEEALEDCLL